MTRLLEPVFLNFTDGEWDTEAVGDALIYLLELSFARAMKYDARRHSLGLFATQMLVI